MRLNPTLLRPSLTLLLAAAALAALPAAHADAPLNLAASTYTETPDGALLLNAEPVRLSHAPALVASQCIRIETDGVTRARDRRQFVNDCGHAMTVSYCIAADGAGARRCDDIGHRGFDSVAIPAGGRIAIAAALPIDAEINWVGCRAADNHYSTLIDNGLRGECLVAEGPTAIAKQ